MDKRPYSSHGQDTTLDSVTLEELAGRKRKGPIPELRLEIVKFDERVNRGTIHPPGLTGLERMETWLSANLSVFVELAAWR